MHIILIRFITDIQGSGTVLLSRLDGDSRIMAITTHMLRSIRSIPAGFTTPDTGTITAMADIRTSILLQLHQKQSEAIRFELMA